MGKFTGRETSLPACVKRMILMTNMVEEIAKVNAEFVLEIISRAAKILREPQQHRTPLIDALQMARDHFLEKETKRNHKKRTYSWSDLINDLKWHLVTNENADPDSWSPIGDWEREQQPTKVADTLLDAGKTIALTARERTIAADRITLMTEEQFGEHLLMQATANFLRQQDINLQVKEEREDPNSPIDYRGTLDGIPWAFELTQLRIKDPKGTNRKIGHPKDNKPLEHQLEELEEPIPQAPDGPRMLQQALNNAVEHGQKPSKKAELNGAKYCLVIHNKQFLYIPDWDEITWPDLSGFDAVMILHVEITPPVQVWQVIPENAFGKPTRSGTVEDIERLALIQRTTGPDPETVKAAWQRLEELDITDEEILEAVRETKGTG